MWEFVDKVVFINLDSREDRRIHMATFFSEGKIPDEKILRFPAIKDRCGPIGALRSHQGVIQMAKDNSWKRVLVLEDDVKWNNFEKNYSDLCDLISTANCDVCMVGGCFAEPELLPKVRGCIGGYAYIVNLHYYDALLNNMAECLAKRYDYANTKLSFVRNILYDKKLKENWYAFDVYWIKLQLKDTWIGMNDSLIDHDFTLGSDISVYVSQSDLLRENMKNTAKYVKNMVEKDLI